MTALTMLPLAIGNSEVNRHSQDNRTIESNKYKTNIKNHDDV